jgi:serine/threonine protein kinase
LSETLSPNTTLGPYTILSKIGEGGMGEVWRARDSKLGRDVAIKVLPAALSADKDRLARFEQEAQSAGALNHPNILVIHHIGTHEGAPYIVSELLEGETLRERMAGNSLPQRKAIDYALQIAHGLAAAHEKKIVHRDLKPDNLFITKDGRVKILDFGLAKLVGNDGDGLQTDIPTRKVNTDPGTVMGTVGYMSPEQLRGQQADHSSDIFSFGAILYEMLSGRRAFRGQSTADTISAILREDPPDLSETNKAISPALERVVHHCLEKNPEERFHSASDLGFAIEALSGSAGTTTTVLSALPSRKKNFATLLPWAIAGATLIATAVLAWLYFHQPPVIEKPVSFLVSMPKDAIEAFSPVISPDGRSLVFVVASEGKRLLYVRPLGQLEAQPMAGTDDAGFPFWSPDSRYIGFFSNNKLKKIEATGGPVQTLCDAPSGAGGTWNSDGVILIGLDIKGIGRVPAAGGTLVRVLSLDESRKELAQAWPVFLPDGNHFLYQSWNGRSDSSAIFVAALDGRDRKLLLNADSNPLYASPGYLLFARNATLTAQSLDVRKLELTGEPFPVAEQIAYNNSNSYSNASVSADGTLAYLSGGVPNRQLIWFDRSGKQLESVGPPGEINDIVLSRDGKRIAIQRSVGGNFNIWLMDLARGVPSRFTFEARTDDNPVWSPDGNFVAFSSGAAGAALFDLYRKPSSGLGNPELLFKSDSTKEPTDWSSDGRFILFNQYGGQTGSDVCVLPLFGDGKPYPLLNSEFDENAAFFSPDGHWFAYTSNETGRLEVYIQTFPQTGGKWLVSNGGGAQPHWRGDGKELFYVAPDKTLMSVEIKTGSAVELGAPKPLFVTKVRSYAAPNRYVVAPDGQKFLINAPAGDATVAPITVVVNWASGLKK